MEGFYQNKYRTHSTRLQSYDYSDYGYYFITLCTDKRKLFFGRITERKMILNNLGKIIDKFWHEIPKHFENTRLDEYIIMPNHIHGIIIIKGNKSRRDARFDILGRFQEKKINCRDAIYRVSKRPTSNGIKGDAINGVSTKGINQRYNPMGRGTLGEIIRWFKGRARFEINQRYPNLNFKWQGGYYDHIIRDKKDLDNIREYIDYNPDKWQWDRNNPKNYLK